MSAAAPTKPTSPASGYDVARPLGQCSVCNQPIPPESKFMTALQETPQGYQRIDTCLPCWEKQPHSNLVAFWQATMPRPEARKKLFVDDTILCELFERLSSATEPAKVNFRFVLGLILMRKRLVIYENTRKEEAREVWTVRMKGRQDLLELVNPHLDEAQIREVSQQLNDILSQEL